MNEKKIYTILDRVSGLFQDPFVAVNDAVAVRMFKTWTAAPELAPVAADLDLFLVGKINLHTGEVEGKDKPEFMYRLSDIDG